jgi:hypothetical protein
MATYKTKKKRRTATEAFSDLIEEAHRVAGLYRREGEQAVARELHRLAIDIEEMPNKMRNPKLPIDDDIP